jgi:outer membrane protein
MKNGLLVLNIILAVAVGYLLITHFTAGKSSRITSKASGNDSIANSSPFRIAYFEMDSVESNYQMVKDVKAELSKKESEMSNQLDKLGQQFQQKYNYFQGQAQAGKMNQTESESASLELKNLDDQIKNRKQALDQEYNDLVMRRMKDVKTNIEDFLKDYNKDRRYTYIVSYEQGLFYFKDSTYNVTADVVKGLNELYKKKKD